MKRIALIVLALVFSLGLALNVYAQTTQGKDMDKISAKPMSQLKGSLKVSDLMGATVENRQGDNLGKISDFAVDPKTGHIDFVVLSHGGVLGIGDKFIAVPLSAFETRWDKDGKKLDALVLNMSKDKLAQAPNFDKDHWPNRTESERTYRYFGQTPYWGSGKTSSTSNK